MSATSTTAQAASRARLGGVIKSARDIMRKDAGLNGDLDRLPQISWLLFLRAFEVREEERRITEGDGFRPALEPEYQWGRWADNKRLMSSSACTAAPNIGRSSSTTAGSG